MIKIEDHIQLKDAFKTIFEPNVVSFYNGSLFKGTSFIFDITNTIKSKPFGGFSFQQTKQLNQNYLRKQKWVGVR